MSDSRAEKLLMMEKATRDRFLPFFQFSQDVAENCFPQRADFTTTINWQNLAGDLMDGMPIRSRQGLGDAIDAMLRQGPDWFVVGTGDEMRDKRPGNAVGLHRATARMHSIIKDRRSRWMDATKTADQDWVAFGQAVMSVEEASTRDYLTFRAWHPRDCSWILDENGRLDTFFRRMKMTARNMKRKFDSGVWSGTLDQTVARAADEDPGKEFDLIHVLMATDDIYGSDAGMRKKVKHKFISIYLDCANRTYLNERGSKVFNYVAPRMGMLGNSPFGMSTYALNSLPDSRMLQDMKLVVLEQGQKAVDPPTLGAGQVFTRDLQFFAGGHTEVDLGEGQKIGDVFTTLDTGERINVGFDLIQDVRSAIAEAWILNRLMLPTLRDMREVEVMVRTEEFRRAALPFFQPIESNYHAELLDVTWQMAVNMGQITPDMFTSELRDKDVSFTFDSPLNEAEGKKIVDKFFTVLNVAAAAGEIDKTAVNMFDIRTATEAAMLAAGDAEWIFPEDQREEKDQEADVVSGLSKGADIARQAAGVTSDVANASMSAAAAGMTPAPAA